MANDITVQQPNQSLTIGTYLNNNGVKKFVEGMLKERAGSFIASLVSITNLDPRLKECTPQSLMMCGLKAASMNLPIDPNIGCAYPVPFRNRREGITVAQFQMGYRGYVQLAMRTGQYKKIVVTDIREGEIVKADPINEDYQFNYILDEDQRDKAKIIAYYAMFELSNGFVKAILWPYQRLMNHAKKYSKSYNDGPWQTNQDEMCRKTMLRQLIPKWGPMSVEMQDAFRSDMSVVRYDIESGTELPPEYPDNPNNEPAETEPSALEKRLMGGTEDGRTIYSDEG
jgi:recombination protein RecT